MELYNDLPLFALEIAPNSEEGVSSVALVAKPAIKKTFVAFNEARAVNTQFSVTSEDRRIVSGPLLLAGTPIYRVPPDVPAPCYVYTSAETIEKVVQHFFDSGMQRNVNLEHSPAHQVQGCIMFESFISDSRRGVAPMRGYEDAPEGSWFGSFLVNNDEVWQQVKAGQFTGFSIEGLFSLKKDEGAEVDALLAEVIDALEKME